MELIERQRFGVRSFGKSFYRLTPALHLTALVQHRPQPPASCAMRPTLVTS